MKKYFILFLGILLLGCNKDDGLDVAIVPPRDLAEVSAEDDDEIREFLQTHFYNYEEFANPPMDFDYKIAIDTIAGTNAGKTPLIDQVVSATIDVRPEEFTIDSETIVPHTLYYLIAREGIGEQPTVADSAYVRYKGSLLNGNEFDGSFNIPVWFDLAALQGPLQGARGFSEGIPYLKTGGAPIDNGDGTFTVEDYGIGMIIMPSGLGFFNAVQGGIPEYSPLIFEIDLYTLNTTDHDGDGIPSIQEDLDGDGYLYNDNTDQEDERSLRLIFRANFQDSDDDQDTTPTRDEIIIDDQGNITFPDSDSDGTPDYLDKDS